MACYYREKIPTAPEIHAILVSNGTSNVPYGIII